MPAPPPPAPLAAALPARTPGESARRMVRLGRWFGIAWLVAGAWSAACGQTPAPRAGSDPSPNVDPMTLLPQTKTVQSQRVPIFFPPEPRPLDVPVAHGVVPPGRLAAPPELAMFVHETFYPALSTHLFANTLNPDVRAELGDYHAAKVTLQKEIRAELGRWRDQEPAARLQAIESLGRLQAPRIEALEERAERFRRRLATVSYNWGILREWHLQNRQKRGFSPVEVAKVMRGYGFYQRWLLPRQRRLLQEITMELLAAVEDPGRAGTAQPYFFFSPEPARVLLPPDLPPELSNRLAEYQARKSRMKKELYDAVVAYDGAATGFWYNPIKTLVKKQEPQFAELDTLAEEIRRGLAQATNLGPTSERPPLPPVLVDRISALLRRRATIQREATVKADAIVDRTFEVRVRLAYRFDDQGMKYVVIPGLGRSGPITKAEDAFYGKVRSDLGAVADEYGHRLAELLNEESAIREEARAALGQVNGASLDQALMKTTHWVSWSENEEAYRDYRDAVFEPGLSPGQRRILFDGAIERLDLPLPRGEMQITARSKSW